MAATKKRATAKPADVLAVVLTTVNSEETAKKIARSLIEERAAACVNVISSVQSHYRWKREILCDTEWLLLMKTPSKKLPALKKQLFSIHPYSVPEWVVLKAADDPTPYLDWAIAETRAKRSK